MTKRIGWQSSKVVVNGCTTTDFMWHWSMALTQSGDRILHYVPPGDYGYGVNYSTAIALCGAKCLHCPSALYNPFTRSIEVYIIGKSSICQECLRLFESGRVGVAVERLLNG